MENFVPKTAEQLYGEWRETKEATSKRIETLSAIECGEEVLPFIASMNSEREHAFIAGYDLAIAETIKYMEQATN